MPKPRVGLASPTPGDSRRLPYLQEYLRLGGGRYRELNLIARRSYAREQVANAVAKGREVGIKYVPYQASPYRLLRQHLKKYRH
jgi:hypothetical protein